MSGVHDVWAREFIEKVEFLHKKMAVESMNKLVLAIIMLEGFC